MDSPHPRTKVTAEGRSSTPFRVEWTRAQYERLAEETGLKFTGEEFTAAEDDGRFLGVRRFMPSRARSSSLGFPLGARVRCFLKPDESPSEPN